MLAFQKLRNARQRLRVVARQVAIDFDGRGLHRDVDLAQRVVHLPLDEPDQNLRRDDGSLF